jgi:hypothetical protein
MREFAAALSLPDSTGSVQGLGHMFARNVKVSMEEMRQKQFDAASVVLRRQFAFLATGERPVPHPGSHDDSVAPIGDVEARLDEQSAAIWRLPERDGDADVPGTPGQLRLRRTVTCRGPGGRKEARSMLLTSRDDIFALNSLCEKWVRSGSVLCISSCCIHAHHHVRMHHV